MKSRHRNPIGGERELLGEPIGNLLPTTDLTCRQTDLPDIGAAGEGGATPRRPRAKARLWAEVSSRS